MYLRLDGHGQLSGDDQKAHEIFNKPAVDDLDQENVIAKNAWGYHDGVENDRAITDAIQLPENQKARVVLLCSDRVENRTHCSKWTEAPDAIAELHGPRMNHGLNATWESIDSMVEAKAHRRRVLNIPSMFPVNLIQHSIKKVAYRVEKEKCTWNWMLWIIAHSYPIKAEKNEPWRPRKNASQECNLLNNTCHEPNKTVP